MLRGRIIAKISVSILVSLIRTLVDLDLAEGSLEDAFEAALALWPGRENTLVWLTAIAPRALTSLRTGLDNPRCRGASRQGRDTCERCDVGPFSWPGFSWRFVVLMAWHSDVRSCIRPAILRRTWLRSAAPSSRAAPCS